MCNCIIKVENQQTEINRISLPWAAVGKLGYILRNSDISINLNRTVFNSCVPLVIIDEVGNSGLTIKAVKNKLSTIQQSI